MKMDKVNNLLSHIQIKQATGEASSEEQAQMKQLMAHMEEAHEELAGALVRGGLIDKVQEIEGGAIQPYRARLNKVTRTIQNSSSRIKVASQKEVPVQLRKLGRGAKEVDQDQHVSNL